jgi:tRNA(adenine34) deaminase
MDHKTYMQQALAEAEAAFSAGEVPVGAALIDSRGSVLALAHNRTIELCDASAHAEILALRAAGEALQNYRLPRTALYVTIEPCIMCMGALIHARVEQIVYGAKDPRWGAAGSLYNLAADKRFNHQPEIIGGVCEAACRDLMVRFFQPKRSRGG